MLERYILAQRQSLPLEAKIVRTERVVREFYEYWAGQVYVAFSGGLDSTVLIRIVRNLYPNVPGVFADTGLEFPEIREFVKTFDNIIWVKPKMNFKTVLETYGYPVASKEQSQFLFEYRNTKSEKLRKTRLEGNKWGRGKISKKWRFLIDAPFKISHKCCDVMKKRPSKVYEKETGRKPFMGTMANDSQLRELKYLRNGCNAFEVKRPHSTPLGPWLREDAWAYIKKFNVLYCKIYDMGEENTGCIFCMFGCHLDDPNRFQRMKTTHPKLYDYCLDKLGLRQVLDFMSIPYE